MAIAKPVKILRFDRFGKNLGHVNVLTAEHMEDLTGVDTLTITTLDDVEKGDHFVWIDDSGKPREHIADTIERTHDVNATPITTVTCINSICELWGDWISEKRPSGTIAAMLASVLDGTRWTVGTCGNFGTYTATSFYHVSIREAVASLADICGGELETVIEFDGSTVTARKISIIQQRGASSTTKRYTWTKDIIGVKRTVESANPVTRVYGYGKGEETEGGGYGRRITFADINGGKEYVEDAAQTAIWGHYDANGNVVPEVGVFISEDTTSKMQLLNLTRAYLETNKYPLVSYDVSVVDLAQFGREWERVALGDRVAVIDKGFSDDGVRISARIAKITRDLVTHSTAVEFGSKAEPLTKTFKAGYSPVSYDMSGHTLNTDSNAYSVITYNGVMYFIRPDYVPAVNDPLGMYVAGSDDSIKRIKLLHEVGSGYTQNYDAAWTRTELAEVVAVKFHDVIQPVRCVRFFYEFSNVIEIDAAKLDTSDETYLDYMFYNCTSLEAVTGLDQWNTSNAVSFDGMFENCYRLKRLDVSGLDTANVFNFEGMFFACYDLVEITGLDRWDTSSAISYNYMFYACASIQTLDFSAFRTNNGVYIFAMIGNFDQSGNITGSLTTIYASSLWDVSKLDNEFMFGWCNSLVGTAPNGKMYRFTDNDGYENRDDSINARLATASTRGYFTLKS